MRPLLSYFTTRNIATVILVLFCTQYIPLESRDSISYLKLCVSLMCPLVIIVKSPFISRPMVTLALYYALVLFAAIIHPATLRWSTVLFLATFLVTYITFYNLVVVENAFSKEYFALFLRRLILVYFIFLVLQHILLLLGIKIFPLLNLVQDLQRGIGANSLSYEPSSVAVIMSFAFLSLLRMRELDFGRKLTLAEIWENEKFTTFAFVYIMIGIVSGTAMVALAIIASYFIPRKKYIYLQFPSFP